MQIEGAPERPMPERRGDTLSAAPERAKPRTDTIALVEASTEKNREVPTWLAVVAIVLLSLVAGMTTYLVRLKSSDGTVPASTASIGKTDLKAR